MSFFKNYRTPFGYVADGNQVDAYGVDHSNFSTRDEVEYQFERFEKEKQMAEQLKQQGIEPENYPQLGTTFWGNNPENNYGFGTSNISANVENRQKTPLPNVGNINQGIGINNNPTVSAPSQVGTNSFLNASPFGKTMFPYNDSNKASEQFNEQNQYINSALFPKSMANDNMSYKVTQNNQSGAMIDVNNQDKAIITFDDVYWGDGSRKNTNQIEGGYNNNRVNDRGGPTNFAVTQDTLDEYNDWKSSLRTGFNFPTDVRELKPEQARQILDERFYQAYNIKALQNPMIARNVFDAEINQGTRAGKWLAESINKNFETDYPLNMVISPQLAEKINKLSEADAIKINDEYTQKRMKEYLNLIDKDHSQINNIKSWYNRAKNHYSNQEEFDKLYQSTLDEYLNRKYPQYYNGK